MAASARRRGHAIGFIAITLLLDTIGFGIIIPVLPALLVDLTGASLSRAAMYGGYLAFLYATMQFFCAPVLGNLSDRFGRRPVLLYAIGSLGVDYIIMGVAPTLGWLFLGRAISGAAGASFSPAYAYVADVSPPERRAQHFGVVSAMFGLGFIIGPAVGGLLGHLGPRAPFFAAAGLSLLNFGYGVLVLPESLPPERRRPFAWKRANPFGAFRQLQKHPVVRGVLGALFLWMVANQVFPSTWSFYTKFRFGWSEAMIGGSLALVGAIMVISQATLLRLLVPRLGEQRAALIGITVGMVSYAGLSTAWEGWMMFAWLATWFFPAIVFPVTNALMSHRIAPEAQGELQGGVAGLNSLAAILGPLLMTQLFWRFTGPGAPLRLPGAAFLAASLLTLACLALYWFATRDAVPAPARAEAGALE
ncbi:MAG: TCR/Tet family MFS transporter [Gemmatimonadales bacterium]